jgi:uncharacterized protein YndB with AHSA1/START domain
MTVQSTPQQATSTPPQTAAPVTPAPVIVKRIDIAAPVARVWRALTDYQQFSQWFLVNIEGPFIPGEKVGGQLTFPGKEHVRMEVVVQALQPTTYFAYTWHPYAIDPNIDYSGETPTLVEFHLEATPTGTLLVVTESGFENLPPSRYADAMRMNTRGWEQQLLKIEAYVLKTA